VDLLDPLGVGVRDVDQVVDEASHLAPPVAGQTDGDEAALAAGAQGLYADADGSILIASTISKEAQESAFCEELTHCLLSRCGRPGLNEDHTFVRPFSAFLYQVLKQGGFFK